MPALRLGAKIITATGMAAALALGMIPKPAAASTQSTVNTILGAAALIGGIVLYNNYEHKEQAANSVVGYTRNGGTVYGDQHGRPNQRDDHER